MKSKLEYWIILSLGIISVGIILWFLFSEASPLSAPAETPPEMIISEAESLIDVKKSGEAYWSSISVGDTINIGDVIRLSTTGNINITLADVGMLTLMGPFEMTYQRDKKRQPVTLFLINGTLHYIMLKETMRVPINIATPDGVFEFASSISQSQLNELMFKNISGDLKISVFSGTGTWSTNNQSAVVRPGEILLRNRSTSEMRKESISPATHILSPDRNLSYLPDEMLDGFDFVWGEVENASEYYVRVIQLSEDHAKSFQYFYTPDNSIRINNLEPGIYKIQATSLTDNTINAMWTAPVYFSVKNQ